MDFINAQELEQKYKIGNKMVEIICPECAQDIEISTNLIKGEIVACGDCGAELEVVKTDPVEVELAPEVEEDWGE